MKRHRQSLEVMSSINITNLLDTAFVLLMAFMVVAPTLKSGIPVNLPKVENAEPLDPEKDDEIQITVKPKDVESITDRIYVNDTRVRIEDLEEIMQIRHSATPEAVVRVSADGDVQWDTMANVIATINHVGFEQFGFPLDVDKSQPKKNK
jgi:biopolymer transport protein ExbD